MSQDRFVAEVAACTECYWSSYWSDEQRKRMPTLTLCEAHTQVILTVWEETHA